MIPASRHSPPVEFDTDHLAWAPDVMNDSTIQINGEAVALPDSAALVDVLRSHGIDPSSARGVAVAVNERIVRRSEWERKTLASGDAVEIVTARQGG